MKGNHEQSRGTWLGGWVGLGRVEGGVGLRLRRFRRRPAPCHEAVGLAAAHRQLDVDERVDQPSIASQRFFIELATTAQPTTHSPTRESTRTLTKKTVAVVNGPRSIGLKGNRNRHGTSWLAECRFQSVADYTTENSAHEPQSKPRHKHRRRADNKQRNDGRMVPRLSADGFHCLSR